MTTPEDDRERTTEGDRAAVHDYAGGEIQSYTGRVNRWLLVVYAVLVLWAAYYLVVHWGGLGPGLEGPR